jgi:hypothetical protein
MTADASARDFLVDAQYPDRPAIEQLPPDEHRQAEIDLIAARLFPDNKLTTKIYLPGIATPVLITRQRGTCQTKLCHVCRCDVILPAGTDLRWNAPYYGGVVQCDIHSTDDIRCFALSLRRAMNYLAPYIAILERLERQQAEALAECRRHSGVDGQSDPSHNE